MPKKTPRQKSAPFNQAAANLAALLKEPDNGKEAAPATIAWHLEQRFGVGSQPELRRRLFQRLQLAVEVHGERALKPLQTVAAEARGARKPDRYFCRAALLRLRELNLLEMDSFG